MSTHKSRQLRMKILLGIDVAFLILEVTAGVVSGSLAVLSDGAHMLNDVMSLVVALKASQLAQGSSSERYSYGWQRAEVLGALINSVFLLALCLSIGLEAINRFLTGAEVTNPQLLVIVGSAGLTSNIVGLFLFHDHGHSHGGHSHGHSHGPDVETGKIKGKSRSHSHSHSQGHSHSPEAATDRTPLLANVKTCPPTGERTPSESTKVASTPSDTDDDDEEEEEHDVDEVSVLPSEFRQSIVQAAQSAGYGSSGNGHAHGHGRTRSFSGASLQGKSSTSGAGAKGHGHSHSHGGHSHEGETGHDAHGEEAGAAAGGGHSHEGSMGMRAVFLHVLGDALGNVGVIAAGLFIWLTDFSWRMYADPMISLFITCIIFSSALPLTKSASFILLQGVPSSVPLEQVRDAISDVPGVLNVHELHVWSLSESKTVASVHVMTASEDFVKVSGKIRRVMHRFGIHSSTIQPEIVEPNGSGNAVQFKDGVDANGDACKVLCVSEECAPNSCCPPAAAGSDGTSTTTDTTSHHH